ncbi:MAG: bifunctional aspartate carbamoyltransferase catalytic subunit/aspartate carbamoyltransferase regulatory subunit [Treponema sp.]
MTGYFSGRSLSIIDDLSIEERKYLFRKTKELKKAIQDNDIKKMDEFRINDKDFGIYEVFLESSTRTKESFRNAANFHHVKLNDLITSLSSFNKGESYADTFNTLIGYRNSIFIIRSTTEGVCKWLEVESKEFAKRNGIKQIPSFINAGDGKHEHPTQELLDEFTFLEDNNWSTDKIHIALVGDLYHGRTVHSKADGLKLFDKVEVDLIAPKELAMPEYYKLKMKDNGFTVREFSSIEEYLTQNKVALIWYFTRPQLERMGDDVLQMEERLRSAITFREEFMEKISPKTKFYHPLPRHREHPTIPTFLDATDFNGWERQSINGMYVRMTLLSMFGGKIGDDFEHKNEKQDKDDFSSEEYIIKVELDKDSKKNSDSFSEGVRPINEGIVIDHICRGQSPEAIRRHISTIIKVMRLENGKGGEWISTSTKEPNTFKGLIFRPGVYNLERKNLKRLAAVSPGCTLNIIENGKIKEKYRVHLPPRIYNFEDIACKNTSCVSHPSHSEGVPAMFYKTKNDMYVCKYCGHIHTFAEIWQ